MLSMATFVVVHSMVVAAAIVDAIDGLSGFTAISPGARVPVAKAEVVF